MKELKSATDFYALGIEKCQSNKYSEAIEAFSKSLALHEHWQSYKGLGWALNFTQQYQQAIEAFNKSLALNEHWGSYQGLGSALLHTQQNQPAIEAFNKSLALHEDWQSYKGLGSALLHTQQYQPAIEAFNKSLALHDDWQSYQGIGSALLQTQQHKEGLEQFYRLHEYGPPWKVLHDLGRELIKQNYPDLAIEFFQELMKKYPDEFLAVCSLVSMVKKLNRVSEYQDLFSQLVINGSWDLIEFYENNINDELLHYKNASSMRYVKYKFENVRFIPNRYEHIHAAINRSEVNDGLIMEFGVWNGDSISIIANILSQEEVHGFDSFEGLPEKWSSKTVKLQAPKGHFSRGGHLPSVPNNVHLHKGWFENTIPLFLRSHPGKNSSLIHIDCDIYSSTKTILSVLAKTIIPGTIIIFDEYYNYSGWEDHEFKAFQEFVKEYAVTYEYIAYTHCQVSIRILSKNK